jgi:hypothetical protein
MNKGKVAAFTILELTITMLLTALVIGISYAAFSIVSRSYIVYQKRNDNISEMVLMDRLLKRDFSQADSILKIDSGIEMINQHAIVTYRIDTGTMIRTAGITDTFKVHSYDINFAFEGQPVQEMSATKELNRIDEFSFSLVFENQKIPYHYYKTYSSANLIGRNSNAVN